MQQEYKPHDYQQYGLNHLLDHLNSGLFIDMGMGKTVITLTAIYQLKYWYASASKVLVVAPKRVAENVWAQEVAKWKHLSRLSITVVTGSSPRQRLRALAEQSDIYVISRDNIAWLVANYSHRWPFDMVVLDESSSFKNQATSRFKALRKVKPFIFRTVLLTGTPAPNHLIDLWAQLYLLDEGERLGETITSFRDNWFEAKIRPGAQYVSKYIPRERTERMIYNAIGDICISFQADDYRHIFKLPKRVNLVHRVSMSDKLLKGYREFEKKKVLELADDEITAINAAALINKLRQYANGFVYDEEHNSHPIHTLKLDAAEDLIEAANGRPVLLFYWFKEDLARLVERFQHLKLRQLKTEKDVKDWNAGKIEVGLLHPASGGHGLNLQDGGHIIIWFGPIWSLELQLQANARLDRQGQKHAVTVHTIVVDGTVDDMIIERQEGKYNSMMELIRAVKARVSKPRLPVAL